MRCHLDFETACDLDIKKVGLQNYLAHPSFRVLLSAWCLDDGPVHQVEGLLDLPVADTYHAFNAPFEMGVLRRLGYCPPLHQWRCTMAHAYARSFTGGLSAVGEQVGLPDDEQKLKEGGRLINWFCVQQKPATGEKWERFRLYNQLDVVAEHGIWQRLNAWAPWTAEEQAVWEFDRLINERGTPVDTDLVNAAVEVQEREYRRIEAEFHRLTGLTPNQTTAFLAWAKEHGYPGENLQAATIAEILND